MVYDAFAKDECIAFGTCDDFKILGGLVSLEGVHQIDVSPFVERLSALVDQVLTHDVTVDLPGSTHIA